MSASKSCHAFFICGRRPFNSFSKCFGCTRWILSLSLEELDAVVGFPVLHLLCLTGRNFRALPLAWFHLTLHPSLMYFNPRIFLHIFSTWKYRRHGPWTQGFVRFRLICPIGISFSTPPVSPGCVHLYFYPLRYFDIHTSGCQSWHASFGGLSSPSIVIPICQVVFSLQVNRSPPDRHCFADKKIL